MLVQPESFSRVEDKFKLTLLQIEKRFVDLEMGISELKSKLKDVSMDAVTSLQQRVDDLEDLTMVENVGVIELKKMLEGIKTDFGGVPAAVSQIPKLEEGMKNLENTVSGISAKPDTGEMEHKLEGLRNDVNQLLSKPAAPEVDAEGLKTNIQNIRQELNNLKTSFEQTFRTFDEKIKEVVGKQPGPGVDFEYMNSKLESLRGGIDILSDKKFEVELKIAGLEEKINFLDKKIKEELSEKFVDEIKINKRDITTTTLRVESIEKVMKELTSEFNELNKNVKKFDNFERLTGLSKNVEGKLERLKFIEDQTSKLSSRIETIYDDLNSRFSRIKDVEKFNERLEVMNKKIFEIEKHVAANKPLDIENIRKGMEFFNKRVIEMSENISRLYKEVPQLIVDVAKLNEQKTTAPNVGEVGDKINVLSQRVTAVDGKIGNLYQIVKAKPSEEGKLDDKRFSQIFSQLSAMEDKVRGLEKRAVPQTDTRVFDEQIEELIGKLVFLESRMAAMERSIHETTTVSPVILE